MILTGWLLTNHQGIPSTLLTFMTDFVTPTRRNTRSMFAIVRNAAPNEYAMQTGQIDPRLRYLSCQPGDQFQWLKQNVEVPSQYRVLPGLLHANAGNFYSQDDARPEPSPPAGWASLESCQQPFPRPLWSGHSGCHW